MSDLFRILGTLWLVITILAISIGAASANHTECDSPIMRLEIVLPGYRIGCWLGRPLFEKQESEWHEFSYGKFRFSNE